MATTKITSNLITADAIGSAAIADDAVTGGKLNPAFVQGDIMYASGTDTIARLAKGAAAEVLTMNSGATAPEWAEAAGGGKVLQVVCSDTDTATSTNNTSYTAWGGSLAITPTIATSKMWVNFTGGFGGDGPSDSAYEFRLAKWYVDIGGAGYNAIGQDFGVIWAEDTSQTSVMTFTTLHDHDTTSELTYKMYFKSTVGSGTYFNYNAQSGVGGTWTIFEIGV